MKLDDAIRRGLRSAGDSVRFDPGRWNTDVPVETRRRAPRIPRWASAAAVAAILVAAVTVPLALLSPLGDRGGDLGAGSTHLEGDGLSIEVPDGWDGRISGSAGDGFGPSLHLSNAPLPDEIDADVHAPFERLAPGGIVVMLQEVVVDALAPGSYPPLGSDPTIALEDVRRFGEGWANQVHSYIRDEFSISGRKFNFAVGFGDEPTASLIEETNGVLVSLQVEPAEGTSGYETQGDVDDGLSVTIPEAWTFHQDPSGPLDPKSVFGVGTWNFPKGGDCAPTAAQAELPADGGFFFLYEYLGGGDPADFPPRPSHFQLDTGTLGHYECQLVPSYMIRFRDAGRYFQLHVAFGPEASDSLEPEVLRALDSIEVTAPVPDACPADTGPWADPDCPLPAWTRAVVDEAGYEVTGDTGSALVAQGLGGEFHIWAFPQDFSLQQLEEEGYREAMIIDDDVVYSDGVRMVWIVKGLAVWISGWDVDEALPGDLPPDTIVADLVDASQRVDYDAIDTR